MKKLFLSLLFLVLVSVPNKATAENLALSHCHNQQTLGGASELDKYERYRELEIVERKLRQVTIYTDKYLSFLQKNEGSKDLNFTKIDIVDFDITFRDQTYIQANSLRRGDSIVVNLKEKSYKYNFPEGPLRTKAPEGIAIKCGILANFTQGGSTASKKGASGTAFFVNNKGNIVTNNHVVERCSGPVKLFYNRKEHTAKVVAKDGALDLAVLSSDVKPSQYLKLSKKSGDKLDRVVAAGYPLGHNISDELKVTSGIVSATKGWKDNINEIQIDAALNPGNSGGPVVNDAGNLLGVAVAGLKDRQNLNFAIKSKAVKDFLEVNKISYSTAAMDFDMDNKKRLKLLEESTVFIFCN